MSNDRGPGMADGIPMDAKTSLKDAKKKLKLYPSYASEKTSSIFLGITYIPVEQTPMSIYNQWNLGRKDPTKTLSWFKKNMG